MNIFRKSTSERERDQQMFRELYQDELHYEEPERCKCGRVPDAVFRRGWRVVCPCGRWFSKAYTSKRAALGAWNDKERDHRWLP